MSKRAQQNQSAFNVGEKIGLVIAKSYGKVDNREFNALFKTAYRGPKRWHSVVRKSARIAYTYRLKKAAKAAQLAAYKTQLTGGNNAKL